MSQITTQNKQFSFDNLQPGKTYRVVVRAFNSENKVIGKSPTIEFKTRGKDVAPDPVTNLTGEYDGSSLQVSWEYGAFPKDFSGFIVKIENADGSLSTEFDTNRTTSLNLNYVQILTIFNSVPSTLNITVFAEDRSRNRSEPATLTLNATPLPDPTNVQVLPAIAGYTVSWDAPTSPSYNYTKIYESNSESGEYSLSYTSATTPTFVPSNNYSPIFVKVSHVNLSGIETNLIASNPKSVTPINPNVVDVDAPDQRGNILFTPSVGGATVTWTNPSGSNNDDIAGIIIRYAKTSSPSDYTWVTVPFDNANLLTSATISNLIQNTSYQFSLSAFDKTQNYSSYSLAQTITTEFDAIPPPPPVAPVVAAGMSAGGPFIVRITQQSLQRGTTTPLPIDTSYFKVFMLNSGVSSPPPDGTNTDLNAVEIGTLEAAFNGGQTQKNFYVPLTEGEQRYFYTRAVDTASNVSNPSPAYLSEEMVVIDNAYIKDLSADKITAGRLNVNEFIQVGTSDKQITIISDSNQGRIYSGLGQYSNSQTGFYLNSDGQLSLKDRLTWNPSGLDPITGAATGLLTIKGSIEAQSGSFTGNIKIESSGSLYIGSSPNSGARVVLNDNSIGGYAPPSTQGGTAEQIFLLDTSGNNIISGWSITPNTIEKTSNGVAIKLDSANSRIVAGAGTNTVGIKSSVATGISIWAGSETGNTSSPFYVTNTGFLKATNAEISGSITGSQAVLNGEIAVPGVTLTYVDTYLGTEYTRIPTLSIDSTSTTDSMISILRRFGRSSGIEFFVSETSDSQARRRGRISHDGISGGQFNITAYPSFSGTTSGVLNLEAKDGSSSTGTIDLRASKVLVNGVEIASEGGSLGGYYNRNNTTRTNRISYSTQDTSSVTGTLRDGDLHFEYVN
jgi:hypothetical protein